MINISQKNKHKRIDGTISIEVDNKYIYIWHVQYNENENDDRLIDG